MNPRVLPAEAWTVVRMLDRASMLAPWILAGGTGLALQLGHRISVDLDFFTVEDFDAQILREQLTRVGKVEVQRMGDRTLHARLNGIRISHLHSEVPFLFPAVPYRGLRLADVRDIAAMKLIAVAGRGSRKDFVDLYAYFEAGGNLVDLLEIVRRRYPGTSFNEMHLLRSLVYFDDAEQEPMPRMLVDLDWSEVRKQIEEEVRRCAP